MAVTQQIARLSEADLERCSKDVAALDELISFKLCPAKDHLDLNWAPAVLRQYFGASKQRPEAELALYLSCNGARLANPDHRDGPEPRDVYSDIACLNSNEVAQVAANFRLVVWSSLIGWLPRDKAEACKAIKMELVVHPDEVFPAYLRSLAAFYQEAAERTLCTVMWWD
jgi:hypothetical protein